MEMSAPQSLAPRRENGPFNSLVGIYARVTIGFLLVVWALWQVGFEAIYRHPFPFYGLISPIFTTLPVPALTLGFILLMYGLAARELSAPPRGFYIGAALSLVVAGLALLMELSVTGKSIFHSL